MPTETFERSPSSVTSPGVERTSRRSPAPTSTSSRCRSIWFGRSPSTRSNDSSATGTRSGWATHVPSKPCEASRSLSSRTFSSAIALTSASRREGMKAAIPAHRVRAAAMARLDEELAVGAHERHRHRHRGPVGQHELGPVPELLDHAEDVVPAARVEARGVIAQLVEDLVHLERREDRLDEDGRLDRPVLDAESLLRPREDVVPEPRLEVRLELRQVEVAPVSRVVAEEVEPEVEERAGARIAVDLEVALLQVPAARAHEEHRRVGPERVALLAGVELDRPLERVGEVALPRDAVLPRGRVGVLEVRHEHPRARVERVDDHLAVDRPRDLDPAVGDLVRERRDPPVAAPNVARLREEVGQLAAREPPRALHPSRESLAATLSELPLEVGQERDGVGCEDVVGAACGRFSQKLARGITRRRGRARSARGRCTRRARHA